MPAMEIHFIGSETPDNFSGGLCDEYRLSAIGSLSELAAAARTISANHPGCRALFTLDDRHQARYTSGHAANNLDLADACEEELAALPAECFEDGEYLGYLCTKAEFGICLRNFRAAVAPATFEGACAHGLALDEQALQEWLDYQQHPVTLLDQPVSALVVPVEQSYDTLAAFPNGYFTSDLDPAQNHAVARQLAQNHGYELMGVGASYLGFWRAQAADAALAQALAQDLCALYNVADRPRMAAVFAEAIIGRAHVWLRYTE